MEVVKACNAEVLQAILNELRRQERHDDWSRRNDDYLAFRDAEYRKQMETL
jgi:hypothetical protein